MYLLGATSDCVARATLFTAIPGGFARAYMTVVSSEPMTKEDYDTFQLFFLKSSRSLNGHFKNAVIAARRAKGFTAFEAEAIKYASNALKIKAFSFKVVKINFDDVKRCSPANRLPHCVNGPKYAARRPLAPILVFGSTTRSEGPFLMHSNASEFLQSQYLQ